MIEDRNIIIFGEDWGRFPSTTQHIGKILLGFNRVMWVGSLAHRKPRLSIKDLNRISEKLKKILFAKEENTSGSEFKSPIVIHPFFIPLHDIQTIRKINKRLLKRTILKAIKKNNFDNPILITSTPIISGLIGELGETSSHYFCLDDYSLFDGAFDSLIELEKEILLKVSSCFAISELLVNTKKNKNGHTYFLPQGVMIEHFKKEKTKIPTRLRTLKRPIVGFFGLISEWIDLELIVYSAKKLPQFTFLIIGKPVADISLLNTSANIKLIGEVPYNELPNFASAFDVGIIPFKVNELTLACNPLKMLEYLALGIPVVSVNLPEISKFKQYVEIANGNEDFVEKISTSSQQDTEEKRNIRVSIAEKYSWHSITESVSNKILSIEKN